MVAFIFLESLLLVVLAWTPINFGGEICKTAFWKDRPDVEMSYYDDSDQNNDESFEFDMLCIGCHSTFVSSLFGLCFNPLSA